MRILLTGGTGLIGRQLTKRLADHQLTVLTRNISRARQQFPEDVSIIDSLNHLDNFDGFDAVINLAGEPIVDKRWSEHQKGVISTSRWGLTEQLVEKFQASSNPPHTFISGSAVGYYSDQKDKVLDESVTVDAHDFAHQLCANWERIAGKAASDKTRVCILRTGIVLSADGGAMTKMLLPYKLGLGGPIGSGSQFFPWIHINDMVEGIVFLLDHEDQSGPFNLSAPNPVTNKEFSQTLAKTLKRPHILFTPAFAIKLMLGEAGQLLLDSQRAIPKALTDAGYQFRFPELAPALQDLLKN
ncbi:TIGR01777 family protein [Veronia nyctiphanis]|uniref:TIGR01777 family protein n=1 Tax=Veronia nyctiphanis TaxID=1278244 RepID=A0A4Q0YRV6_9GAMM|nr:TIGR01777 family oxidoreductase [Veronia nyctiphanis]RXJ73882.1 TIGR01777 family protein [Veronia nyctiphanis]